MNEVADWDGRGPLPMLYTRTATGGVNTWLCWVEGPRIMAEWGQQGGALQRSSFTCKPKNEGRANATTAEQQAIKEAIAKWRKQVKNRYSTELSTAGETKRIKPMLAKLFDDHAHKLVYPVAVQPKLDGLRCLAFWKDNAVYLQSRRGDPILLDHIKWELTQVLPPDCVLDGELYIHGASRQHISSLVRRPRYPESAALYYCVYDVMLPDKPEAVWSNAVPELVTRASWLSWFFSYCDSALPVERRLWQVPSHVASSRDDVQARHDAFVNDGYEGAVVRNYTGTYREGYRSPHLLKLKRWIDAEFEVIGWTVGKGRFEHVPIFKCKTAEGGTFDVTPKGTQGERLEMLKNADSYIGKQMTVKYFSVSDEKIPHGGVGLGLRDPSDLDP
jgi:DNA ligase-1